MRGVSRAADAGRQPKAQSLDRRRRRRPPWRAERKKGGGGGKKKRGGGGNFFIPCTKILRLLFLLCSPLFSIFSWFGLPPYLPLVQSRLGGGWAKWARGIFLHSLGRRSVGAAKVFRAEEEFAASGSKTHYQPPGRLTLLQDLTAPF